MLVLEYAHRKELADDELELRTAHGYVLAGHDDEDVIFLDTLGAAPGTLNGCLMDRWKLRNPRDPERHIYTEPPG